MKIKYLKLFGFKIILLLIVASPLFGQLIKKYPPFYIYKVSPEQSFVKYWFNDIKGKLWTSDARRARLFITGRWRLRYDIRKWAQSLVKKTGLFVDVVWVFNPSNTQLVDQYDRAKKQLQNFEMPIPAIIDSHSFIGRAVKIDYDIPTLIGVTRTNNLAFVYSSPLNKQSIKEISVLIRLKLLASGY